MADKSAPLSVALKRNAEGERYVFLDALRGVAALGVLLHHLLHNSVLEVTLRRILPFWAEKISEWGAHGVQIFFVLSGFVIAHSLRRNTLSGAAIGNFILRRQFRLDPPYWAMLIFALALGGVERLLPGLAAQSAPDLTTILLNAFYLQDITGTPRLLEVAWTLCIEIQFYLLFILLLALSRWWQRQRSSRIFVAVSSRGTPDEARQIEQLPRLAALLIAVTGILSLWIIHHSAYKAWAIHYWFYFAAGVLCYWSVRGLASTFWFSGFCALFGASALAAHSNGVLGASNTAGGDHAMLVGLGTSLLLFGVGRAGALARWGNWKPLQYLGRLSYSLYLVHLPLLFIVMRGGYKLTGERTGPALAWAALAGVCSILAAHAFHRFIEKPSMEWTARLKAAGPAPAPPASTIHEAVAASA